jgi:hypothetical protein
MKLAGKLLVLLVLVWGLNKLLFRSMQLPLLWGVFYEKQAYYEANKNNINTVFLGSSLTYRQVNSQLFDSMNTATGHYTRSLNLGFDGCQPAESYKVFNYLIETKTDSLKTLIVELTPPRIFKLHILHALRNKSFDGFTQFSYSAPLMLSSNYPLNERLEFIGYNFINVLEAELNFSMLEKAYKFKAYQKTYKVPAEIEDFTPSEKHEQGESKKDPHLVFLTTQLSEYNSNVEEVKKLFANPALLQQATINTTYIQHIQSMLKTANDKHIKLIYVLPPRLTVTDYKDLLPVYETIPAANRISIADPYKNPQYYSLDCSYDMLHINSACIPGYTQQLQQAYQALIK